MQISDRPIPATNPTLSTLIAELGKECSQVVALINQLQLAHLQPKQQAEILAELLAATVHLHAHCDSEFQLLIAAEMEELPDDDEED
jgi:hypothetical protein